MAERSAENAKETTRSFSKEQQNPLGNDAPTESKPGITFAAQDKLPKLPIPDLEATCKKYLASLDPLQNAREHNDSVRAVHEFLQTEGPDLQAKLKAYSEGKSSYIEQFCTCECVVSISRKLTVPRRVRLVSQLRQPSGAQPEPFLPPGR